MDKITLVLKQRIYAMLPFMVWHTLQTRKRDSLQLVRAMVPTYMASALLEEGPTSGPFSPPKTYIERPSSCLLYQKKTEMDAHQPMSI